jgi:hypothetical protein
MKLEVGTRICSLAGRVKGTVVQILDNGAVIAEPDLYPETIVVLPPRTFRLLKPNLTARDLVLLREMGVRL